MTAKTPGRKHRSFNDELEQLVRRMPPLAIRDAAQQAVALKVIDELMRLEALSPAQAHYLETLVQLVEAYESKRHAIDLSGLRGVALLMHIMDQSGISPSDLGRLLGIHPSMGSKILSGRRRMTWDHAKILAAKFRVAPALLMD
jgi:HTH-type transcriptional regulator/antitoxin HigA